MNSKQTDLLVACRTCAETVSKNAKTCPHCGENKPFSKPVAKSSGTWKIWTGLLLGYVVLYSMVDPGTQPVQQRPSLKSMCIDAIRASVNNPSSLDIHLVTGYASDRLKNGTERVTQTFSAENDFGARRTYDARCILTPTGKFDMRIVEEGR